ncbi:MAG: DNA polymerase III subunit delta [Nitrospinae bacterium]|nr:DNA polymerase III subunit delta [Nitrospinota bacterium]
MNYSELIKKIDKGEIGPLYLFHGVERFLIDEAINKIIARLTNKDNKIFNLTTVDAHDADISVIIDNARTLPFLGDRRVLIIKGIDEIKNLEGEDMLISYCSSPSLSTCLIFIAGKIDLRKRLYAVITKNGEVVHFNRQYENQVMSWLYKRVGDFNLKITEEARRSLWEMVGNDLQRLNNELEKIITYIGDKTIIRRDDVEEVVGYIKVDSIFELTDAIGEKNVEKGLGYLHNIFSHGEPPLKILIMIIRQFRLVWQAKVYKEMGYSPSDIAKRIKVMPYLISRIIEQSRRFDEEELKLGFYKMLGRDIELKTSDSSPLMILESLILDLCN